MYEIIVALFLVFLVLWLKWRWERTSIFSNLGIPGPKPSLLFGNIVELYAKGPVKCHEQWVQKYGRIVGYFYGMKPVLLVADPQLLKNIFIKDFSKFTDREPFNPLADPDNMDEYSQSVLILKGHKWKEIRSVLTPSFSTAKMKLMASMMNDSIDMMLQILDVKANSGETIELMDVYQRLTMDVISKTAFGVVLDVQTEKKPKLLRVAQLIFRTPYREPFVFIGLTFPLLRRVALKLEFIALRVLNKGLSPILTLRKGLLKVLEHRKTHPETRKRDLLQLMIDSKVSLESKNIDVERLTAGGDDDDKEAPGRKTDAESKVTRSMTDKEIVASAFTVFLAGYETTSTALGFTSYLLAAHPSIQEQVYEEICDLVKKEEKLEYGTINKLPFLDKVFNESLRIFPPVYLFTNRFALEDVHYGPLKIPKGMLIQAPVHLMHHDPDLWPDPYKFDPERFNENPNRDGVIFLPFGVGPRNCLGMRFAQMEAKLALAHMVYNYSLELPAGQKGELKTQLRIRTISPDGGVKIKLEKRRRS